MSDALALAESNNNLATAMTALAAALTATGGLPQAGGAVAEQKPKAPRGSAAARGPAPAVETPAAEPEPKSDAPAAPDYSEVKNAVLAMSKAQGREAVVKLLDEFGVTIATDLKPEQYAEFISRATAPAPEPELA